MLEIRNNSSFQKQTRRSAPPNFQQR